MYIGHPGGPLAEGLLHPRGRRGQFGDQEQFGDACIYIYTYMYTSLSLYLSLSMYIYIYIYMCNTYSIIYYT